MSIRVLVVDDHEVVRTGLASLLKDNDIQIIDEAADGRDAVRKAVKLKPDVVLLDVRMEEFDGLMTLEQLRKKTPDTRVVMLSTYENPTYVARAVALGAVGYVLKSDSRQTLIDAIRRAAAGEPEPNGSPIAQVKESMRRRYEQDHPEFPLTSREMQVLRHIALGLSNREIGHALQISVETVKEHVQNILRKLEATDRTQAAVMAVRKGLV